MFIRILSGILVGTIIGGLVCWLLMSIGDHGWDRGLLVGGITAVLGSFAGIILAAAKYGAYAERRMSVLVGLIALTALSIGAIIFFGVIGEWTWGIRLLVLIGVLWAMGMRFIISQPIEKF